VKIMSQLFDILGHLGALHINPLGGVVAAALLAALLEQRWRRRHAPFYSNAYLEAPPPTDGAPRDQKPR
jgi:hypothetical protein